MDKLSALRFIRVQIANFILRPYRKTQGAKQVSGETFGTRTVIAFILYIFISTKAFSQKFDGVLIKNGTDSFWCYPIDTSSQVISLTDLSNHSLPPRNSQQESSRLYHLRLEIMLRRKVHTPSWWKFP
jgi:hypothetical protein